MPPIVIPSAARNPSLFGAQEKRDSSARSAPRFTENVLRERNDIALSFSVACEAVTHKQFCVATQTLKPLPAGIFRHIEAARRFTVPEGALIVG